MYSWSTSQRGLCLRRRLAREEDSGKAKELSDGRHRLGEDVGRADVLLDEFQHRLARALAVLELGFGIRELRRAVRQAESERFDGGGHGVRGIHTAARAFAGDGADFDLLELIA